jgi:hypothetical protein
MEQVIAVQIHLPISTADEMRAFLRAADALHGRYTSISGAFTPAKGDELPTVMRYEIAGDGALLPRREAVYTVHTPGNIEGAAAAARVAEIQKMVEGIYKEAGAPQQEIFMLVHQAYRPRLPRS